MYIAYYYLHNIMDKWSVCFRTGYSSQWFVKISLYMGDVCVRLVQLVRSLTANQEVLGSIPGLVEG